MENEIEWQNVVQITAYKEDLITTDEICVFLQFNDGQNFKLNESSPKWDEFIIQIENNLLVKANCLADVTFPPFERKETILYINQGIHV